MVKSFKIFEADDKQEAINELLKKGFSVASLREVSKLRNNNEIPEQWYDLGLVFFWKSGILRNATMGELKDIKKLYDNGGRLLFVGVNRYDGLNGDGNVIRDARFVGVKKNKKNEK